MEHTDATLLIGNFERPPYAASGIADGKDKYSERTFYSELNESGLTFSGGGPRARDLARRTPKTRTAWLRTTGGGRGAQLRRRGRGRSRTARCWWS